jgi:uncharacterized protein
VKKVLLVAALALAAPAQAQSPASFSCRNASTDIEATICAHPELGKLDHAMTGLYHILQGMSDNPQAKALLNNQRNWLAARDACQTVQCLTIVYQDRIAQLSAVTQNRTVE